MKIPNHQSSFLKNPEMEENWNPFGPKFQTTKSSLKKIQEFLAILSNALECSAILCNTQQCSVKLSDSQQGLKDTHKLIILYSKQEKHIKLISKALISWLIWTWRSFCSELKRFWVNPHRCPQVRKIQLRPKNPLTPVIIREGTWLMILSKNY